MAEIARIEVWYVSDSGKAARITLDDMIRHCRPERVQDLVEDLAVQCEDVVASRRPEDRGPLLSVVPES